MGQDDKNGQKEGLGQAQAEPLPQEGDQALLISRPGAADQQDVVKRASEVKVNDQAEGAAKASSSTTEGQGQESKQADSTSGVSTSNTRKRKEQASTPTKKAATKGKTGGDGNGKNSAKKVRTGKEDDIFGSDIESDNEDDNKGEEDKDIVLEDADPVVDPDETEDEQDHLKAAGKDGKGANGEEGHDKKEEGAAATDANTAAETGTSEPRRIIRKPHGHSKSLGANVLQPGPAAAPSSSDGGKDNTKDNTKSNTTTTITTSGAGTTTGNNGNGKEKPRSLSTSAASGKVGGGGGGAGGISPKGEEKSKSGGVASKGEEEEGKEHQLKRKGSINEILNEEEKEKQDTVKVPAASLPPRDAKEVAEEKIAGGSGTRTEDHAGPGTGGGEEVGKKTAAADGAAGGAEADKSGGGTDGK
ncbi:hypothetical protein V8F06_012712 [Rhypophila decipiens]